MENGELVAAILLVRSQAAGIPAPFFYAPRGPVCADPNSPALPYLIAFAKREARSRGGFFIRAEPNVLQDDRSGRKRLRKLGFRPTDHTIYLRGAWVTDLRPEEDDILANMMTTWRQNIRAGGRKGLTVRLGSGEADLDAFYQSAGGDGRARSLPCLSQGAFPRYAGPLFCRSGSRATAPPRWRCCWPSMTAQPIAAATVAVLGKWSWNLHSGSSGQTGASQAAPQLPAAMGVYALGQGARRRLLRLAHDPRCAEAR